MPPQPPKPAPAARPLWIIAISLATIAVCLVLMVIKLHLDKQRSVVLLTQEEVETIGQSKPKWARTANASTSPQSRRAGTPQSSPPEPPTSEPIEPQLVSVPNESPTGVRLPLALATVNRTTNLANAIIGRVYLHGTPPPDRLIDLGGLLPTCPELRTNPPKTRDFVVGPNAELADVLVTIVGGLENKRPNFPPVNSQWVFADCELRPYFRGFPAGQRLSFRANGNDRHSIRLLTTNSTPFPDSPTLPVSVAPGSERRLPPLRLPEDFVRITCEDHPWEIAYVSALAHPYFSVTDTNGLFVIPNVPPGKYQVRARHLKAVSTNDHPSQVVVTAGQMSVLDFTLDVSNP